MTEQDNPPEVYKVIGAPGTGKTTRVVGNPELPDVTSLVMENLEEYPLEKQLIVTYTNAGVDEAADRLEKILDAPRYKIDERVVTIHAHAYRTLGVDKDQVVRYWHKQQFCSKYNLDFGYDDDSSDDIMSADKDEGNALFDIYGWLKSNRLELSEWGQCPADYPGDDNPEWLMERWEDYKDEEDLIGFSDMIEKTVEWGKDMLHEEGYPNLFGDQPEDAKDTFLDTRWKTRLDQEELRGRGPFADTKVMYVDEVQDLTPLQWTWYLMQKLVAEKVYIGGDDDQTIYGWAGANPNFMLDEEGDFEVLDKTYRIPREIWETCDEVIQQVDKRQEKEVEPHGDGGEVTLLSRPTQSRATRYLEKDDALVLFRARYMIDEFRETLHKKGIPYRNMSTFDTWSDDITTLRDALAKIDNGADKLTSNEVDVLKDYAVRECNYCRGDGCSNCGGTGKEKMINDGNGHDAKESALGKISGIKMDRVKEIFETQSGTIKPAQFLTESSEVNYYEKNAILGNIRNNNSHMDPDRVRIGTIHSAKGKEASTVLLATDSTSTILNNMVEDTIEEPDKNISDAERRVYYVGMTRASEHLILAEGLVNTESYIKIDDLLESEEDSEGQWTIDEVARQEGW